MSILRSTGLRKTSRPKTWRGWLESHRVLDIFGLVRTKRGCQSRPSLTLFNAVKGDDRKLDHETQARRGSSWLDWYQKVGTHEARRFEKDDLPLIVKEFAGDLDTSTDMMSAAKDIRSVASILWIDSDIHQD